jgi:putative RecB family exonuclease
LQFYYERIARLPKPFVSHSLVFGTAVHKVLEHYYKWIQRGEKPDKSSHIEMFSELWKKANDEQKIKFSTKASFESLADTGRKVVQCFIDNADPSEKVLSTSQAFCVPVHSPDGSVVELPLVGEFDLVVEREGKPVIVDFKTAGRKWAVGQAHKSFQATVYSYAWHQMYGTRPEIRFDVVTKAKAPTYEQHATHRSAKQELRMATMISKAQQIVKHELWYPAETGFYCADCPYAGACKEWGCAAVMAA